jgi:hypothetical protein
MILGLMVAGIFADTRSLPNDDDDNKEETTDASMPLEWKCMGKEDFFPPVL